MTQEKLDRINELAHLAKERELTADEQEERAALRKEYIEDWRRGTIELLERQLMPRRVLLCMDAIRPSPEIRQRLG